MVEEGVVRKVSSPKRVATVPLIFAMTRASVLRTWIKESVAPFWRVSPPVHHREVERDQDPVGNLELHGRRGSQKGPKYPQKDFDWRNARALERRARAVRDSVRKRDDWKWQDFRWHQSRPCTSSKDSAEKLEETGSAEQDNEEDDEHLLQAA